MRVERAYYQVVLTSDADEVHRENIHVAVTYQPR